MGLNYDLWLGPVPARPYHPEFLPGRWRNWWAFGGGALGDFGCHYMDLPHWALGLRAPIRAEVLDGPPVHAESVPPWLIVRYEYPAPDLPGPARTTKPLQLTWYHGGRKPKLLPAEIATAWESGVLFIGEKGMLLADYTRQIALRDPEFKDYIAPQSVGSDFTQHHREWIHAVKTGKPSNSDFAYSGPLTEAVLLGNVAFRAGCKIEWDSAQLRAKNCPDAERFILETAVGAWMAHPVGEGKFNCSAVETQLCKLWDFNSFRQNTHS